MISASSNPGAVSRRDLLLLEAGILTLLGAGAVASIINPLSALLIIGASVALFLLQAPLRHSVILCISVMMFDLQRQVGGSWLYVDLSFAALLVPLLRSRRMPPYWWVFFPYTAFLLIDGIPRALDPPWYYGFAVRSVIALIVYLACALANVEDSYFLILGLAVIPLTVYGVYQLAIGGLGGLFVWVNPHMEAQPWIGRAYSLLWQPNIFGGICAIVLVSLIALALNQIRPKVYYALALVCLIGILCSGSRGALVGAFAGTFFAAWNLRRRKWVLVPLVLGVVVFLAANTVNVTFIQRLTRGDETANHSRWLANEIGVSQFLQHPIAGVGPTNFEVILPTIPSWEYPEKMAVNKYLSAASCGAGHSGILRFLDTDWLPGMGRLEAARRSGGSCLSVHAGRLRHSRTLRLHDGGGAALSFSLLLTLRGPRGTARQAVERRRHRAAQRD